MNEPENRACICETLNERSYVTPVRYINIQRDHLEKHRWFEKGGNSVEKFYQHSVEMSINMQLGNLIECGPLGICSIVDNFSEAFQNESSQTHMPSFQCPGQIRKENLFFFGQKLL